LEAKQAQEKVQEKVQQGKPDTAYNQRLAVIMANLIHELMNTRCPNINCHQVIDPLPDGCCAMTHSACQTYFCWVCFEISPSNASCHKHVRDKHGGSVFVPEAKVRQAHRALFEQRLWAMTDDPSLRGDILDVAIQLLGTEMDVDLIEIANHRKKPTEIMSLFNPPLQPGGQPGGQPALPPTDGSEKGALFGLGALLGFLLRFSM
jgi:hypothetical protein